MPRRPLPNDRALERLLTEIRACRACADALPCGPRPVVQAGAGARLLIVGQAPGSKVHASGVPWDDASGERLRAWLGIDRETFYDPARVAIVPMGFCYPGRGPSGDNPPRPECAPRWHAPLLAQLPQRRLTLLIGQYAQRHYLGERRKASLTDTVAAWREYGPDCLPLPHPSPRNQLWFKRHPWFGEDVLPALRKRVAAALAAPPCTARSAADARAVRTPRLIRGNPTMTHPTIEIRRVYDAAPAGDAVCFLIDRLWPRGIRKETLAHDVWLKDVAPGTALRQWYHRNPSEWDEFRRRYEAELDANPAAWQPLLDAGATRPVVLLYGSRDTAHNHAVVLRDYLLRKAKRR